MTRNQIGETSRKLQKGQSERQWKGVYSLEWKSSMAGPGYMFQWPGKKKKTCWENCELSNDHIWSSKKKVLGCWGRAGSSSEVITGGCLNSQSWHWVIICPQGFSHSTSSLGLWHGLSVVVTGAPENKPRHFTEVQNNLCLLDHAFTPASLLSFSPMFTKLRPLFPSTNTWSSAIKFVSLHMLFPLEKVISISPHSGITLSERLYTPLPFTITSHF